MFRSIGASQRGIGRAKDRDHRRADGGGQMHWTAVVGDDNGALPVEFGEFEEISFAGNVAATLGNLAEPVGFGGATGKDNPVAWELPDEVEEFVVTPELSFPASGGVDGNPTFRRNIGQSKREVDGAVGAVEVFG